MRRSIPIVALAVVFALTPLGASATPAPFQLVFVGHSVQASYPSPSGVAHVGPFTTNSALCPSGSGQDIAETSQGVATRLFTCDGSGATFTATINPHIGEFEGAGAWQIIAGTGPLTDLRGRGTFSSVLTSGDVSDIPSNLLALAFRSTWTGMVDLDTTPPSLSLTRVAATELERPKGTYRLSVALALADAGGGGVSYELAIVDRATLVALVRKHGITSAGSIAWKFVIKPSTRARTVGLVVDASDQVGNQSTLVRAIRLTKTASAARGR